MIIARLEKQATLSEVKIQTLEPINSQTSNIIFKTSDGSKPFNGLYDDINMIGKHFLVWSKNDVNVRRHYTIANCMRKQAYDQYI